ncbi:ATP-binding protein [Pseudoponticoccus marisrubri]|uniref:histidine kinase n=1 Tax=Pseudoponticoccus marisrubri TaxID=1685382 RepID=A0A0W7WID0_9RHOB|nr:ATP-binding protein [Pseudoponticoccus marisrubri]KUF10384.1 hypothetical protein AVJ23_13380 [Pseudoponticoccus marisrubri]
MASLVVSLVVTGAAAWHTYKDGYEDAAAEFELVTAEAADVLVARFRKFQVALDGVAGLVRVVPDLTAPVFTEYVSAMRLDAGLPDGTRLALIEPLGQGDPADFAARMAARGLHGTVVYPETPGEDALVVTFIAPRDPQADEIGLNIGADPARRAVALAARDSAEIRLAPYGTGGAGQEDLPGLMLLRPIYAPGTDRANTEGLREGFVGWAAFPLVGTQVLADLTPLQPETYDYAIHLGPEATPETLVYDSATDASGAADSPRFQRTAQLDLFGQVVTISWSSRPGFEAAHVDRNHLLLMAFGSILAVMLAALLRAQAQRERSVTELVRVRTADLEAQRSQNDSIINNPHLGIVITDGSGVVLRSNPAAHTMLSAADCVGHSLDAVLPGATALGEDRQARMALRVDGEGRALSVKRDTWQTPEGATRSTFFLRDVTREEQDAQRVAETEQRLELALRAAEIGVFEFDLATGQSHVSDTWKRIMGVSDAGADFDYQGYFEARIDPDDFVVLKANDFACINGDTDRTVNEFRITRDDGTRWMRSDAMVSRRCADGRALTLTGTQVDITDSIEMEMVKHQFIATVSHELRTPLTAVNGAVTLMQAAEGEALSSQGRRLLEMARKNVDRLTVLVSDILDLQHVQTGNMRFKMDDVEITPLLRDARDQILPIARAAELNVAIHAPAHHLHHGLDRGRMLQVLANLLSNACKFAPAGSTVTLGATEGPEGLRLFVRDAGPGVPDTFRSSLFKPFRQADNSDSRDKGGTGLGLSIAREIVERMGGEIGYTRTEAGYTEFFILMRPQINRPVAEVRRQAAG